MIIGLFILFVKTQTFYNILHNMWQIKSPVYFTCKSSVGLSLIKVQFVSHIVHERGDLCHDDVSVCLCQRERKRGS